MSAPPDLVVAGRRCYLRRKRLADAENDYRWRRDPELARLDGREPETDEFDEFVERMRTELEFPPAGWRMFAIESEDGRHVGNLLMYHLDQGHGSCELGISIGEADDRGRGIGKDAVTAFLRHAWTSLGMRMVYLHTFEWNETAIRCFLDCGFKPATGLSGGALRRYEARREWWLMEDARDPYPRNGGETSR